MLIRVPPVLWSVCVGRHRRASPSEAHCGPHKARLVWEEWPKRLTKTLYRPPGLLPTPTWTARGITGMYRGHRGCPPQMHFELRGWAGVGPPLSGLVSLCRSNFGAAVHGQYYRRGQEWLWAVHVHQEGAAGLPLRCLGSDEDASGGAASIGVFPGFHNVPTRKRELYLRLRPS